MNFPAGPLALCCRPAGPRRALACHPRVSYAVPPLGLRNGTSRGGCSRTVVGAAANTEEDLVADGTRPPEAAARVRMAARSR
jgi:hypothetical protein